MAKLSYNVTYKKNSIILPEKDLKTIVKLLGEDAKKILKIEPVKTFDQTSFVDSILKVEDQPAAEVEAPAEEPKKLTIPEKIAEMKNNK